MNGQKTNNSHQISNIKDRTIRVSVNPTFNNSYLNKTWLNLYTNKKFNTILGSAKAERVLKYQCYSVR